MMTATSIRPEIRDTVRKCIAESLAVPVNEIKLTSRLADDLGFDSLDFVDVVFMLERELGINVRETEFNFLSRLDYSSSDVMRDGFLTAAVVDKLSPWLPAIDAVPDRQRISPRAMFSLITVESICLVAQRRVDAEHSGA